MSIDVEENGSVISLVDDVVLKDLVVQSTWSSLSVRHDVITSFASSKLRLWYLFEVYKDD